MALTKVQIDGVEFSDSTDLNVDNGTLVVDSTNNRVGVGTSSPSQLLQVNGTAYVADDHIRLLLDSGNGRLQIRSASDVTNVDLYGSNGQAYFAGNVGIGTTSPGRNLHVHEGSTSPAYLQLTNSSTGSTSEDGLQILVNSTAGYIIQRENAPLTFQTNNTERARIDSSGRLLVGTSSAPSGSTVLFSGNSFDGSTGDGRLYLNRGSAPSNGTQIGALYYSGNAGADAGASLIAVRDGGTWTSGSSHPTRLVFSTTADGASSPTERMRIDSNGNTHVNYNATYTGTNASLTSLTTGGLQHACIFTATNAAYQASGYGVLGINVVRAANSAYNFAGFYSNDTADREFQFRGDGNGYCDGSWSGGGADYAEYFEWSDFNIDEEDRRGISVVLDGDKIREAVAGEEPIGVISGNPSVVGDAAWNKWNGKHLRDEYGSYLLDENGERQLNPIYDPDQEYVSRENRPEWDCVGLMGKLRIRKGQVTGARWIKMRDVSDTVEEWLVR